MLFSTLRSRRRPAKTGDSMRLALLGTRGAPAHYGGFETAVEEIGKRMAASGHDVTVYCRTGNSGATPELSEFEGMKLVHLPAVK